MIVGAILLILAGSAFGDPCGKERWEAKTHTSGSQSIEESTVESLRAVPTLPRAALEKVQGRLPAEQKFYTVDAILIGFKREVDSDFHLVIASPKNKNLTMIAEAISPDCTDDPKLAQASATVRKYIEDNFGRVTAKFSRLRTPVEVTITGMFFLDFIHGQTGVAGNGCELHPLTAIQKR